MQVWRPTSAHRYGCSTVISGNSGQSGQWSAKAYIEFDHVPKQSIIDCDNELIGNETIQDRKIKWRYHEFRDDICGWDAYHKFDVTWVHFTHYWLILAQLHLWLIHQWSFSNDHYVSRSSKCVLLIIFILHYIFIHWMSLNHCSDVICVGDRGQQWFSKWFVAWRHLSFIWHNVD